MYYILYRDRGEDWIQFQGEIIYSPGTIYYTDIEEKIKYRFKVQYTTTPCRDRGED